MTRAELLDHLVGLILRVQRSHPIRVGIDGVDASGKTTLADELAPLIEARGRPAIRASIDGVHHPRAYRYRRGRESPEGYYYDSFDYEAVRASLLLPLGPTGNRQYCLATVDSFSDSPVDEALRYVPGDSTLLFDGVFLLRPELEDCWDFTVFLRVDFDVAVERASRRDPSLLGAADTVQPRYRKRYVPGQRIYLQAVQPEERADVVIENNDPTKPRLVQPGRAERRGAR